MTAALLETASTAIVDAWPSRALDITQAALQRSPDAVTAALLDYYAADNDACGVSFLDGTETVAPHAVTAGDLFAVTTLGLPVRPAVARRLLHDTTYAADVAECLAAPELDPAATLSEARAQTFAAMTALHTAVLSTFGPFRDEQIRTVASAICARKRPELFPVLDARLRDELGLPTTVTARQAWVILRTVLREPRIALGLESLFASARAVSPGTRTDIYPLRQLYVLLTCLR